MGEECEKCVTSHYLARVRTFRLRTHSFLVVIVARSVMVLRCVGAYRYSVIVKLSQGEYLRYRLNELGLLVFAIFVGLETRRITTPALGGFSRITYQQFVCKLVNKV